MLRRALLIAMLALGVTGLFGSVPPQAVADPGSVRCSGGMIWNALRGACVLDVSNQERLSPKRSRSGSGEARPVSPQKCVTLLGKQVPCHTSDGWFSNSKGCYAKLLDPQPPKSDSLWEGHKTGSLYECFYPGLRGTSTVVFWSAASPAGPPPPDPRVLAARAVALMRLRAVRIGIVPEDRPGRVGVIGLPTWMWVADRGPATWGPVSRSVSAGGYTVRATARVDRVVWSMGDRHVVVCRRPGTPYEDRFGKRSSPDCGYTYSEQGTYIVRATSYWRVDWSGVGQSGTIRLHFTRSTVIRMGEVQVLVTTR